MKLIKINKWFINFGGFCHHFNLLINKLRGGGFFKKEKVFEFFKSVRLFFNKNVNLNNIYFLKRIYNLK